MISITIGSHENNSEKRLPPCKKVAIVGGGLSGIGSIKALKEEGIEPICFEKSDRPGGTWNYREEDVDGIPSVMWTTVINHSKEMGAISNFPPPKQFPNYMKHTQLFAYIQLLDKKFGLFKHIRLNTEVVKVSKANDYDQTGKWVVTVKDLKSGETSTDIYDGVIVGCGHINYRKWPQFKGMETFKGQIIHSHSLKRLSGFKGKKVAVVGMGCSALDAAVEISAVADKVYLSMRTPSYILSRVGPHGMPIDYCLLRRYITIFQSILPLRWASWIIERYYLDRVFNHKLFGIEPKYPFLCRDPILNDHIGSKILSGSVVLRKDIDHFEEDGVFFEDEKNKTEVDTVIMATGYQLKFPFLDEGILEINGDKIFLYKCIFPAHLPHHTLAFVGFALPIGPGFPLGELQTRYVAHLFGGKGSLPDPKTMRKDVEQRHERNSKRFSPSEKMTIRVDYIPYCDELASQFGVKPNFWKMMFTDPRLFIKCIFGPSLSYQYRLCGPHKWPEAREHILTAHERMQMPLSDPRISCIKSLWNWIVGNIFIILIILFLGFVIASPFISWKASAVTFYVFYTVTIVIIIAKCLEMIIVNRSFWS